jgi:hypothetical protein
LKYPDFTHNQQDQRFRLGALFWKRMPEESTLYRPVGQAELELVRASGFKRFPPRLPHQPIFYPVLNEEYATQIARDWNPKDEASGFRGYVLRFKVRTAFLQHYQIHIVGSSEHEEYWIPAEDLQDFNENIVGAIEVISEFPGKD